MTPDERALRRGGESGGSPPLTATSYPPPITNPQVRGLTLDPAGRFLARRGGEPPLSPLLAQRSSSLCTVCETPLHLHLVESGETTHPNCAPGDRPPGICGICGGPIEADQPDRAVCDACRDQLARQLSTEVSA